MKKVDQLVLNFLLDRIPDDLLRAYDILAQLQYPINDRQSFQAMLPGNQQEEEDLAIELLTLLDVNAFPIASPQNAFEKFHELLPNNLEPFAWVPVRPGVAPPPGTEAFPWWVPDAVRGLLPRFSCLSECDRQYQQCMVRAGDDLGKQLRCVRPYYDCQQQCGP